MPSEPRSAATRPDDARRAVARGHARSQLSHFATTSGLGIATTPCDRCGKPMDRWSDPCDQPPTLAAMLAHDVLYLLGEEGDDISL